MYVFKGGKKRFEEVSLYPMSEDLEEMKTVSQEYSEIKK
jgi:hypothetical protein